MNVVHSSDPDAWRRAAELLETGSVVAVPTDTIYGVAAAVSHPRAVVRLFALKARDASKPVAVLVSGAAQAGDIAQLSPAAVRLAERFWPGALTLVLPRAEHFTVDLGGAGHTVGVRAPAHDRLIELCDAIGPLATTSANRSGHPTPPDGASVAHELGGTEVALVIDDGSAPGELPSTVVRVDGNELTVLREGPVGTADLQAAVADVI
ncbi:MAG TPA: L-threonylcarbamoyladenylate synthase [Microthrixaceae bacterium]|nr:L-threonylcarbamoyladenylate synthase [Microthrixaceae bacterium]